MKSVVKYFIALLTGIFFVYLLIPSPDFPIPLEDTIRSGEPADMETLLRREYYTNILRDDVMTHYKKVFSEGLFKYTTYRLNYPPEEAQTRIRDQTRSTYLEEIVHPFRESIYVNGFEPKLDKDVIVVDGKDWNSKVVVRYYPSNLFARLMVGVFTMIIGYLVYIEWKKEIGMFAKYIKERKWILR